MKGINTLGVVNTDEGSEIMLEDNEEGEGSKVTTLNHAGSLTAVGNHQVETTNTLAGSKMVSFGQRVAGAAAPVEEAAPADEAAPEEEEEEELQNLSLFPISATAGGVTVSAGKLLQLLIWDCKKW